MLNFIGKEKSFNKSGPPCKRVNYILTYSGQILAIWIKGVLNREEKVIKITITVESRFNVPPI
jgi:hypothetical protein